MGNESLPMVNVNLSRVSLPEPYAPDVLLLHHMPYSQCPTALLSTFQLAFPSNLFSVFSLIFFTTPDLLAQKMFTLYLKGGYTTNSKNMQGYSEKITK